MGRGLLILGLTLAGLAGCASPAPRGHEAAPQHDPAAGGRTALSAVLLFDRHPSETFSPQDFTYREPWPSTKNGVSMGEFIEYRELFIDRERDYPYFNDNVYRRFTTRRTGQILR